MKKKLDLNLKHQRATAMRIAGMKKNKATDLSTLTEQQLKLKYAIAKAAKGNLVHVDNVDPAEIVKANPRPKFDGTLVIENPTVKPRTTIPDDLMTETEANGYAFEGEEEK